MIYIAASFPYKYRALEFKDFLHSVGYAVSSGWIQKAKGYDTDEDPEEKKQRLIAASADDFAEVRACDTFVMFTEGKYAEQTTSGGRHAEFGMAVAHNKKIVLIGPLENVHHYSPSIKNVSYEEYEKAIADFKITGEFTLLD